jgi:hypothetical protein
MLVSLAIYELRISKTTIPAGRTALQIAHLTQVYDLDSPVIEQYGAFLFKFIPGLTLLGFRNHIFYIVHPQICWSSSNIPDPV